VDDVQHVADDRRCRVALGELVLDVVMGGAAAAVEQTCPPEGVGPGADAGDGAAICVMGGERLERCVGERAGARDYGVGPPAGDDDEVVFG
jgi:hypothetical protein